MTSTVTIVGNLTRDPELRFPASSQPNATFGVAVNRRYQNRHTNEWVDDTSFFNVVAWSSLAENVAQSLKRGDRVVVEGRLDQHSWNNAVGEKRSAVEIIAEEIGASVRFATVEIKKKERPIEQAAPADGGPRSDGVGVGAVAGAGTGVDGDDEEEPF